MAVAGVVLGLSGPARGDGAFPAGEAVLVPEPRVTTPVIVPRWESSVSLPAPRFTAPVIVPVLVITSLAPARTTSPLIAPLLVRFAAVLKYRMAVWAVIVPLFCSPTDGTP